MAIQTEISTPIVAPQTNLEEVRNRLMQSGLIAICVTDLAGVIVEADDGFVGLVGYTREQLLQSRHQIAQLTPAEHQPADQEALEKVIAFGSCASYEKHFIRRDGSRVPVLFGGLLHEQQITWFAFDLSNNQQARERINHLAYHDALTRLPNQSLFKDRLKQAIALSSRSDQMQAVLLLNVDRFKTINDSLGYTAGDQMLQAIAQRLTSCVRESDTVARFGADEFAVLLLQLDRAQDAANVAKAIKQAVEQAFLIDGRELCISSSIGISLYPHDGRDTPTLLKSAGVALQCSKEKGQGDYEFYTSGHTSHALKQLLLESQMRPALERGEFVIAYQPQVDVKTFQLVGMEALVRWNHPALGTLQPADFIQLAEDTGMIIHIGDWVLRMAFAQNKLWLDSGFSPMQLAVNVSARQFQQRAFIGTIRDLLKETDLDPALLELELTEASIMKEPEKAIEKLNELRDMGIKIAIDDFGTGYSSLSYLKRFPIDTLKIDKTFVSDVSTNEDDAAIVKAIVMMGHALDITVIAEGVETPQQLEYLTSLGCDVIQGYLFSAPLSTECFTELLMEQLRVTTPSVERGTTQLKPLISDD
ncbi:MAG TPA: bifunctional diguanylate cyclase/phosphodiesterase [Pyrinomonadaceae bacterium]|nr:bifunctional diguanylate cyclase/phosphodiesterase [Pyrinomonadaceae bacterium]